MVGVEVQPATARQAVVMEAYVHGAFARCTDDLVIALGADSGISRSGVSRSCERLDETSVRSARPPGRLVNLECFRWLWGAVAADSGRVEQ